MNPLPVWNNSTDKDYPIHALTQRPMAMYHSWGTQNAWLRQIHGVNPLICPNKNLGTK
jgi:anaerobic selenocysteine-containing dehydrogenase